MDFDVTLISNFNKYLIWLKKNKYLDFYEDGTFVSNFDDSYGFKIHGKIYDDRITFIIDKVSSDEYLYVIIKDENNFYHSKCEMYYHPKIFEHEGKEAFRINNMFFAGSISQESREKRLKRLLSDRRQKIYDGFISNFHLDYKINSLLCSIDEKYADIFLFIFTSPAVDDIPRIGEKRVTRKLKIEKKSFL